MKHYEFSWQSPSQVNIYAQGWFPETTPKAIVLLIHGLGEHSSRYEHVAEYFVSKNIAVLANDRSGHGKSGAKRGHIAKYEETLDDIVKLHSEATRKYPKVPVILYGHSMGGNIVINYLLRKPKNGLAASITTAPAIRPAFEPPKFLIMLGKLLRGIYPSFSQNNQLDLQFISRDPLVISAYKADNLVHDKVTTETGLGLLEWGEYALEHAASLQTDLLLMHGSKDGLTSFPTSKEFAEKAAKNVEFVSYDGLYHELHNEPEKLEVLERMHQFICSKI